MDTCSPISLSIIVPVYNAEQTLTVCLQSILQTKREDIELLLIDDGSNDTSAIICEEFSDKDSRVTCYHKQNGGVSSARNLGLEKAQGEWIAFVDADDMATAALIDYMPKNIVDLVCFNWQYTTGDTERQEMQNCIYNKSAKQGFLKEHLADFVFRTPWAKLFRRNLIELNGIRFDERFKVGEDNLFMLDYLAVCGSIETQEHIGYIYFRPQQGKYPLPLQIATLYMTEFMGKYEQLGYNCPSLLMLLEYYFFTALGNKTFKMRKAWGQCNAVRRLQDLCWKQYGIQKKKSIIINRIFYKISALGNYFGLSSIRH